MNDALMERINKKYLELGGKGDPEGSALVKKIQGIYDKVKPGEKSIMFKVKSTDNDGGVWLGAGKWSRKIRRGKRR